VTIRQWLAAAALSTGLVACVVPAASAVDPTTKNPAFGFTAVTAMTADAAKAKAETWLKSAGKFDQAAFDTVWQQDRPVLDRVVDSLALGSPEAKALVADARKADGPAPHAVPAILTDTKQDAFFRTNLAIVFARSAGNKKAYEEALEALTGVSPEAAADPASFYFFKAVSEHALMRKEAAFASAERLIKDVTEAPDRYKVIAFQMAVELVNWSPDPKDMSNIERLMDNSGRRLDLSRPGEKTQDIQKKIVFRLDELIKEMENKSKSQCQSCNGGNCPNGGNPGDNPSANINPNSPATDSRILLGSGPGNVDEKALRKFAENWGTMPPDARKKVVEDLTRDLPPKYKPMIDEYFKSLNRIHGYSNR
jgi:hypothetical protein